MEDSFHVDGIGICRCSSRQADSEAGFSGFCGNCGDLIVCRSSNTGIGKSSGAGCMSNRTGIGKLSEEEDSRCDPDRGAV
jgi:hypothetical protein